MTHDQFEEFTDIIIPQQLFHVDYNDIDDETGVRLEEVILLKLIYENIECLKYKSLGWFVRIYLHKEK